VVAVVTAAAVVAAPKAAARETADTRPATMYQCRVVVAKEAQAVPVPAAVAASGIISAVAVNGDDLNT
jgi:hypothetical protein